MKWTGLNDLRETFLAFYESKGHLRLPSFSLVPQNDKSLLLINSGMAPMKKYFHRRGHASPQTGDHLPEVHPDPRYRTGGKNRPPRHLLRDAGQFQLRRLFQARGDGLGMGILHAGAGTAGGPPLGLDL